MNKLKTNVILNTAYQLISLIFPLITMPYVGKILGTSGIGEYTYKFSTASLFAMFCMMGIRNYGIRGIASCHDDYKKRSHFFSQIWSIQITLSFLVAVVYCGAIFVGIIGSDNKTMAYMMLMVFVSYALDINWLFTGLEEFRSILVRNIIVKVITLILLLVFIKREDQVLDYTIIMLFCYILSNGILFLRLPKFCRFSFVSIKECFREHFSGILVLFIPAIAVTLYHLMDKVMLGAMCTAEAVGNYEYAEKTVSIPMTLTQALGTAMLPRMSAIYSKNKTSEDGTSLIKVSLFYSMTIGLASAIGLYTISNKFVLYFYGETFMPASEIIKVLSIKVFIVAISDLIRTQYMIPKKMDREYVRATIVGAIINLILNAVLIPVSGAVGASIATVISELMVSFMLYICVRKVIPYANYIGQNIVILALPNVILWFLTALLMRYWCYSLITLIMSVMFSGIIYMVFVIGILYMKKVDIIRRKK